MEARTDESGSGRAESGADCAEIAKLLFTLKALFVMKASLMHNLSKLTGADIVPTALLPVFERLIDLEGVVGCAVSGAGGMDAFYVLYTTEKRFSCDGMEWNGSELTRLTTNDVDAVWNPRERVSEVLKNEFGAVVLDCTEDPSNGLEIIEEEAS